MKKLLQKILSLKTLGVGIALSLFALFSANTASAADSVYLIGVCTNWKLNPDFALTSTSNGYTGTFNVPKDGFTFRFMVHSTVTGITEPAWNETQYASQISDSPISITLSNDTYSGSYTSGTNAKGSWKVNNWNGGQVQVSINTSNQTVTFTRIGDIDYSNLNLYVIGGNIDGASWKLMTNPMTYNPTDKTFVWEGAVLGCDGFKINGGSWDGSYNIGAGGTISLNTPYTYNNASDSGDIKFANTAQIVKNPKIILDINAGTLTVTGSLESMPSADQVMGDQIYLIGQLQDWNISDNSITLPKTGNKIYSGTVNIPYSSDQNSFRIYLDTSYGWHNFSYGPGAADENSVTISSFGQAYNGSFESGEANWILSTWNGGTVDMTVNFNTMKVDFVFNETPRPEDLTFYVRGANVDGNNTWDNSTAALTYNSQSQTYVWEGESLGSGFKISDSATGWSGYNIGSQDGALITLDQPFEYFNNGSSGNINFLDPKTLVNNPVLTLDLENGTLTLEGTEVAYTPKEVSIYYQGVDEPKFNLTASSEDPTIFTGVIEGLTANDSFKVVLDGAYWYSWGEMIVFSNVDAIKKLDSTAENYNDYSSITNANGSDISVTVNWKNGTVTFAGEQMPVLNPETMWLVGPFNDWTISNQEYTLEQTEDNSGIYTATFNLEETYDTSSSDVPEIGAKFKIAFGEDWDTQSFGNVNSQGFNIYASNTTIETNYAVNGPNWMVNNWVGGEITVTIDLNKQTVTIECPDQPAFQYPTSVKLMGSFDSWTQGYDMEDLGNGSYSVSATLPAENVEFKILADDVWYGALAGQSNIALKLNTPVEYEMTDGEASNWTLVNFAGGDVVFTANITEDGTTLTINQTTATAINGLLNSLNNGEEVIYNLQGVRVSKNNLRPGIYVVNGKKVMIK